MWKSTTRCLTSEETKEGWAALAISILLYVSAEEAFRLLSDGRRAGSNKYGPEDIERMHEMKKAGLTWDQIGAVYNTSASAACKAYKRLVGGK